MFKYSNACKGKDDGYLLKRPNVSNICGFSLNSVVFPYLMEQEVEISFVCRRVHMIPIFCSLIRDIYNLIIFYGSHFVHGLHLTTVGTEFIWIKFLDC